MGARIIEILIILLILIAVLFIFIKRDTIRNHIHEILAGILILIAVLLPFHQQLAHNFWFHRQGFWNHEALEACSVTLAIGLLLGKYLGRRKM
jgi:putative effector of murein hydrolase